MLGLDYSGGRPSGAAIRQANFGFVVRYLDNGLSGRVNLTAGEVADLHANGVAVALVWEKKQLGQPDRVTLGRPAGVADALAAQAQAVSVGLPNNPVYFAIDFDIPDYDTSSTDPRADLGPAAAYFDGVLSVLPRERIGVYGGFYAVKRVLDAGLAEWAWQTAAWSGGQEDPRIHLLQRVGVVYVAGVQCDVNESRKDNYGQNGVDDMPTADEIAQAVWQHQLDNPKYDEKADPASGEGKKSFPAAAYTTVGDMTAQEVKAGLDAFATQTAAALQLLGQQMATLAKQFADAVTAMQAAAAAGKPGATAIQYEASGPVTLTPKPLS